MHRSSDSIATLAAALARAQTALVNPEKTMAATIRTGRAGDGPERSFRYAPLSSGLDIVRKALGQHEIAVMQTTSLDDNARLLRLNTVLAHSSGEWIASDWPVCPLSDVSSPQRMGAALTYARRYGLFALVGIAGEDDLDAPDLHDGPIGHPAAPSGNPSDPQRRGNGAAIRGYAASRAAARPAVLSAEASSERRDELLREIAGLASSDEALAWALRTLPTKNRLCVGDATAVEAAFTRQTKALTEPANEGADTVLDQEAASEEADQNAVAESNADPTDSAEPATPATVSIETPSSATLDRTFPQRLPTKPPSLAKPVRRRDAEHLRFVASQPCLVCARLPSDAHHLRHAQVRAFGRKVSDEFTVPLCRTHHREVHRTGKEKAWWTRLGIKPLETARRLWAQSHGQPQGVANASQSTPDDDPRGRSAEDQAGPAVAEPQVASSP